MNTNKNTGKGKTQPELPDVEAIQQELAKAESTDDFFGRDGITSAFSVQA